MNIIPIHQFIAADNEYSHYKALFVLFCLSTYCQHIQGILPFVSLCLFIRSEIKMCHEYPNQIRQLFIV